MAKCTRCNRELKNHHESEMGDVCRMKADRASKGERIADIRVEPLFIRRQSRRSYLVFTSPRKTVIVQEDASGRSCEPCCGADVFCSHIAIVAQIDRAKFPSNLSAI